MSTVNGNTGSNPNGSTYTGQEDAPVAEATATSTAAGTPGDVGMSTTSARSSEGGTGVPTRGAPPHSGLPSELRDTAFEHAGAEYALVPSGHEEWQVRHPDGRAVGKLAVISHAGEEAEAVFVSSRLGSEDAVAEGTDWRGLVSAVINDEAADQREGVDLDPAAVRVRGGLISREATDVTDLS